VIAGGSCCSATSMVHDPSSDMQQRQPHSRQRINRAVPTPVLDERSEDPTVEFAMFCPICMYYYGSVLKTNCCGHHLCSACMVEMARHSVTANDDGRSPSPDELAIESLSCPHCNSKNLRASRISSSEEARRYDDSPALHDKSAARHLEGTPCPARAARPGDPSPLKIGDTYESMMRKMLTYDQCGISLTAGAGGEEPHAASPSAGPDADTHAPPPLPEDAAQLRARRAWEPLPPAQADAAAPGGGGPSRPPSGSRGARDAALRPLPLGASLGHSLGRPPRPERSVSPPLAEDRQEGPPWAAAGDAAAAGGDAQPDGAGRAGAGGDARSDGRGGSASPPTGGPEESGAGGWVVAAEPARAEALFAAVQVRDESESARAGSARGAAREEGGAGGESEEDSDALSDDGGALGGTRGSAYFIGEGSLEGLAPEEARTLHESFAGALPPPAPSTPGGGSDRPQ